MNASAKDLRIHSKQLLKTVSRGEEVIITYHGKPLAKLVPVEGKAEKRPAKHSPAFGMWANHPESKNVQAYGGRLRQGRV